MLNVLIVYAVEEERVQIVMPNCNFHYCRTGVGKIAAALAVEHAIAIHHPDVVLNIGTAGTLNYELGSIHLCCKFIDRDMEKLQNFGVPFQVDFEDEVEISGFFKEWRFDSVCNTGDTFLTSADGTGDVLDMESFAVSRVCQTHHIPFVSVKCVTDIIGQNSIKHWEEKLAEAQAKLQLFVDTHHLIVPENYVGRKASSIIQKLNLEPHPEGGWFKEIYRSEMIIKKDGLTNAFNGNRNALTSIYFLLSNQHYSAFHRIKSPETWYFHEGMPLIIHVISTKGAYQKVMLANNYGGLLQYTVEPGSWFAAEIKDGYGYSLVSCAVAPGFDFKDFELADNVKLRELYPRHSHLIYRLT